MMEEIDAAAEKCDLCRQPAARRRRVEPDRSLYDIVCRSCGVVYRIGGTAAATMLLWPEERRDKERELARSINARGFIHRIGGQPVHDDEHLLDSLGPGTR